MMQSWENVQKFQFGQFFDDFKVRYLPILTFSEKEVSFKLKVIFSTNFRPKTRKIVRAVFEKNISVWFWANLETFSRISPNQEFFSKIRLSLFYLYSPLTSCKKSEKFLRVVSEKTALPTNQPTTYYQQHRS